MFRAAEVDIAAIGIDGTVGIVLFNHSKVRGDERIACPVQQACRQPVMLRDGKPFPVIGGYAIKMRDGTLLEQAKDVPLILRFENSLAFTAAADLRNQLMGRRGHPSINYCGPRVLLDNVQKIL